MVNNKDIYLIENSREIDVIEDYWTISQECRDSYYHLKSLLNFLTMVVIKDLDDDKTHEEQEIYFQSKVDDLDNKSKELMYKFEQIDKVLTTADFIDLITIPQVIKDLLEIKSKIDKQQYEILDFITEAEEQNLGRIIQKYPVLNDQYLTLLSKCSFELIFNHSADEDRINNYILTSKNHVRKELSKQGIIIPEKIKLRDYSFLIIKKRATFKAYRTTFLKMLTLIEKHKEKEYLKELSEKQEKSSRQVTFLTRIIVLLTVLMLLTGGLSTYYTVVK